MSGLPSAPTTGGGGTARRPGGPGCEGMAAGARLGRSVNSAKVQFGAVRARTLKGPIQRCESNNLQGSGVYSVSSSTSSPRQLRVPSVSVELSLASALVLPLLQQCPHLCRHAAYEGPDPAGAARSLRGLPGPGLPAG